ncbi:tRNA G18 (ribose-2'-O)-methylase SpoU [Diaminobutyricimonas aerilata]|uniref:tRNA G18 (Ribose-2'-O)-methylase SpoU n=1 Tax=Diaminobutyricimonas aerilata TaxID=1162967 RepID=A0A2M9CJW2_9MICO|nr:RNA methyltransferase [Diaminobutyricimonas aerilata]PJJ72185.1 tRNA G18 (ribose-2'-O)-methylase SpoU [Diaminobutyricimonas aerilata]
MIRYEIDDADDPRLSDYRDLTDVALRRTVEPEGGLYIAESAKVFARALAAGHRPRSVLVQQKWVEDAAELLVGTDPGVPLYIVPNEVAEQVTGYAVHRGLLASMHRPAPRPVAEVLADARRVVEFEDIADAGGCDEYGASSRAESPKRRSRIAILEGLTDHTNVGACFRSAAAMGVDAVLVTPSCADPLYRRSVRVSMGAVFQVPWTRIDNWPTSVQELQDAGYVVAGMTLGEGAITLDELVAQDHERLALVFGSEGHGFTPHTDRLLDRRVTIPMMGGVDSLNVAASSAVAFYATR